MVIIPFIAIEMLLILLNPLGNIFYYQILKKILKIFSNLLNESEFKFETLKEILQVHNDVLHDIVYNVCGQMCSNMETNQFEIG